MPATQTETEVAPPAVDPTLATIAAQLAAIEGRMERYEQRLLSPADVQQAFDDLFGMYGKTTQLVEVYRKMQRDLRFLCDVLQLNILSDHRRRRPRLLARQQALPAAARKRLSRAA